MPTSKLIDGKAIAADLRANIAKAVASLKQRARLATGPRRRAGRRGSGQPGLRPQQGQADAEVGMHSFEHKLPATDIGGRPAGPGRPPQCRSTRSTASWCSCRCPSTSTARRCWMPSTRRRTSTAFTRSMPASWRSASRRSCPARRSAASSWPETVQPDLSGLEAVVIGRSNIVGKPVAQLLLARELHGDHRPFAHPRPAGSRAAAPTSSSPPSAGRRWSRATGSSPAPS